MRNSVRLLIALVLSTGASVASAGDVAWAPSFEQACRDAEAEHKIVLVDVYTTWCGPCHALDERTWPNADVRKWLAEKAVPVKVDAEKLVDLAAKYRITVYPTVLLLRPDGTEIDRIVGFRDPAAFLSEAADGLAGKDAVARAKAKLDAAGENDPQARMDYARALAQKGRDEEALEEYLWCYDHGADREQDFVAVKYSFLVSAIVSLGRSYSPAVEALELRRDAAEKEIRGGSASSDSAYALAAIDRELDDGAHTLAVYDALDPKSPARGLLFDAVFDGLLLAKRYGDIAAGAGDLTKGVEAAIEKFEGMKPSLAAMPDGENTVASFRQDAVTSAAGFYETLLGLGRTDEGAKAADRLIAFDSTGETYATLARSAAKAGKPDVARVLVARGLSDLPESERATVRAVAAELGLATASPRNSGR